MKILYIHGLNSSKESTTGQHVKEYLKSHDMENVKLVRETFDLLDVKNTRNRIMNIVTRQGIDLVIASSLGAFYALDLAEVVMKIVINPCMMPSMEIPKLVPDVDPKIIQEFKKMEASIYSSIDGEVKEMTRAAFGTHDELFSYKMFYKSKYGNRFMTVNSGHRPDKHVLFDILAVLMERLPVMKQPIVTPVFESFVNLYKEDPKMNDFDKYKDEVYDILEKSYAPVGGMLGIDNPTELVDEANFWKLWRENGKIIAAAIYKIKNGRRKLAYLGSDGTERGKAMLTKILSDDIRLLDCKMWIETSHGVEKKMARMGATPIPAHVVKDLMPHKHITKIHDDGFHYDREINGTLVTKITYGNV